MRDFLDRVIERHFDATPQIKPRLPSLFEPGLHQVGVDFSVSGENGTAVQQEEISAGQSDRHQEPAARSAQSVMVPHSTQMKIPPGPPEAEGSLPSIVIREIRPRLQQLIPEGMVQEWTAPPHGAGEDPQMKLPGAHQKSLVKKEGRKDTLPTESHPQDEQDTIKPRLATGRKGAEDLREKNAPPTSHQLLEQAPTRRSVLARQAEKADQRPTGIEAPSVISPSIQPSATLIAPVLPPVVGRDKSISRPEPVINITIGRVEVRATVSPQKQAPKPLNPSPVMGLEEYLRRRSGGRD